MTKQIAANNRSKEDFPAKASPPLFFCEKWKAWKVMSIAGIKEEELIFPNESKIFLHIVVCVVNDEQVKEWHGKKSRRLYIIYSSRQQPAAIPPERHVIWGFYLIAKVTKTPHHKLWGISAVGIQISFWARASHLEGCRRERERKI